MEVVVKRCEIVDWGFGRRNVGDEEGSSCQLGKVKVPILQTINEEMGRCRLSTTQRSKGKVPVFQVVNKEIVRCRLSKSQRGKGRVWVARKYAGE